MSAIGNLGVLTILFMFISALLAKQFFFKPLEEDDGSESRYSFSSTIQSLITIFIVITGENWNAIMVQVIDSNGSIAGPTIFFMAEMIIGNYMLLNLFLAILLKFISEGDEEEPKEEKTKSEKSILPGSIDANGESINANEKSMNVGKSNNIQANDIADSGPLNSSNSNIEEEFE
jgi:voltage-dependent calcium channel L type alpha-1D